MIIFFQGDSLILVLSANAACFNNRTGIRKRIGFIACNALEQTSTAVAQVGICLSYQIVTERQDVGVG